MQLILHANSSKGRVYEVIYSVWRKMILLLNKKCFCHNNSPYKVTAFCCFVSSWENHFFACSVRICTEPEILLEIKQSVAVLFLFLGFFASQTGRSGNAGKTLGDQLFMENKKKKALYLEKNLPYIFHWLSSLLVKIQHFHSFKSKFIFK